MALTDSHEVSFIDFLAHLVERPNVNQNVAGSIPAEIVSLTSSFFRFITWTVGFNWLTCRTVTPVLRVRVPYGPPEKTCRNMCTVFL